MTSSMTSPYRSPGRVVNSVLHEKSVPVRLAGLILKPAKIQRLAERRLRESITQDHRHNHASGSVANPSSYTPSEPPRPRREGIMTALPRCTKKLRELRQVDGFREQARISSGASRTVIEDEGWN